MKLLVCSDIHGSARACAALLDRIREEKPDRVLLLGDLLYHGPRNALPGEYDAPRVAELLNSITPPPLAVRGNCDSEVDQMMLRFPIGAEYILLSLADGTTVLATHGHKNDTLAPLVAGCRRTVLLHGHTHIAEHYEEDGVLHINPGSTSIPKNGTEPSYLIIDGDGFGWHTLYDGILYRRFSFDD